MSAQFFLMDRLRQEVSMRLPSLTSNPVAPVLVHTFDYRVRALNGSCLLGSGVLAVADCFAGLIWRVDLGPGAHSATARVWAAHDTMGDDPDGEIPWPPQPGVNGVRYAEKTGYLYYTSTAQKVFMRVPVDPATLDAAGTPECSSRPSPTATTSASTRSPATRTSPATPHPSALQRGAPHRGRPAHSCTMRDMRCFQNSPPLSPRLWSST
jgi:hypothetical protein